MMNLTEKLNMSKAKLLYLASMASMVLLAFLPFLDVMKATGRVWGERVSESVSFYEAYGSIFCVLMLLAVAIAAIPLLTKKELTKGFLLPEVIIRTAFVAFFLFISLIMKAAFADRYGDNVKASLTFGGWLVILVGIGGFVLDLMALRELKAEKQSAIK